MRENWKVVAAWWQESEGWTEAEVAEAKAALQQTMQSGDKELIACWSNWLAGIAEHVRWMAQQARDMEARVHAAARLKQEKERTAA